MARFSTLVAISICGALLAPAAALAQSAPGQSRQLTTTPRDDSPPTTAAPVTAPAPRPAAPPAAPLGAAAPVAAPPVAAPAAAAPGAAPPVAILCDGGTVTASACVCPGGYTLLPAAMGGGGTCVRSNADNCRGGVLTVAGVCLCDGRVTMSGETYALEFLGGKCVPKRCPEKSYLKEGKCVASNDTRFSFTCRTGYIPDDSIPAMAASGLRCAPDPTFCPAGSRRKDGNCAKLSAIAIDCFEGRCSCGPNADWVNYLCQCTAPYRNVNGVCVTASADSGEKSKPEPQSTEPTQKRKACGRGMVRTQAGNCVAARPRLPDAGDLGVYYQRAQRYRQFGDPAQPPENMRR